jgi:4-amino-4-deoxy-L-arabinose transferase-like glycosyltransferase
MLDKKINNHYKILLLLCVFSMALSVFLIKAYDPPIVCDRLMYYTYGANLYKGNGYSCQAAAPYLQSNFREPAYPVFIFLLFKIFGISSNAIQFAQVLLNGLIIAVTYCIANIVLNNRKTAILAALLTAISPSITGYAAFVLSETLACLFLSLLLLFFLMLLKEREDKKVVILSSLTGLFCGCLILTKMAYFLFPALLFLALLVIPSERPFKGKAILCISVVLISVLSPWLAFNKTVYGNRFFLTNRGGASIAIKAQRLNWNSKDIAASFIYGFSERLLEKISPEEYKIIAGKNVERVVFDKYALLIKNGYSEMEADKELRLDGLNKIKGHILKYAVLSVSDLYYMLYFEGAPLSQFTEFFEKTTRGAINLFFKIYSLVFIFFSVKGVLAILRNKENYFLKAALLLPVFYTFFIYPAIFSVPRFTFIIIPFIYILSSAGLSDLSGKKKTYV